MAKRIPLKLVVNVEGKPWKSQKVGEDGEPVWKVEPTAGLDGALRGGVPELEDANTQMVLRSVLFSIPRSIQSLHDPMRVAVCFNEMEHNTKDGFIELKDKVYNWLHRLLKRELPLPRDQKDIGLQPLSYAQALWQLNAYTITEQLKDVDEQKPLSDQEFPE